MRSLIQAAKLLFAGLAAWASADEVHIESVSPSPVVGQEVNVTWSSDAHYNLELLLVRKNPDGWTGIQTIFDKRKMSPGNDSTLWTVPDFDSSQRYALWLNGEPLPGDDKTTGYADLTEWMTIPGGTGILIGDEGMSTGQIVGTVFGTLGVFFIIVAAGWFVVRRIKRNKASKRTHMYGGCPPPYEATQPQITQYMASRRSMDSFDSIDIEKEKALADKGTKV